MMETICVLMPMTACQEGEKTARIMMTIMMTMPI